MDQALRGECSLLATLPCVARSGDSSVGHSVGKMLLLSARRRQSQRMRSQHPQLAQATAETGSRHFSPLASHLHSDI